MHTYQWFMDYAIEEAQKSYNEGGIPIGSVLVKDDQIIGRGYNRRIQKNSPILHAEMDCLQNAGRLTVNDYSVSTLYTTLSPCVMCTGAIVLYKIPIVVIGERETYQGLEDHLIDLGISIVNLNDSECQKLMQDFILANPKIWNEDIGI